MEVRITRRARVAGASLLLAAGCMGDNLWEPATPDVPPGGHAVDPGPDPGEPEADPCGGECSARAYSLCTCAPEDPCGFRADGTCDAPRCAEVRPGGAFDDAADCGGAGPCAGACDLGTYDACTCAPGDPCGWIGDGYCDRRCGEILPGGWFDDSADCGGGPACGGDCDARTRTACTCATDDPCGWRGDGLCDDACDGVTASRFDDSTDCSEPPAGSTYVVTSVRDDLDPADRDIVASGLASLGWAEAGRSADVSASTLSSYLASRSTLLYHTGHGNEGIVGTSDGALDLAGTTINVRTTVFATCLTLRESPASSFGPTAEAVLGYTRESFDVVDDDVAQELTSQLGSRSSIEAWYLANVGVTWLADRWAGYVREGGAIVEYSARSGRRPIARDSSSWLAVGRAGGLRMSAELLADDRTHDEAFERVAVAAAATVSDLPSEAFSRLADVTMSADEAVVLAEAVLEGSEEGLPADAGVDRVIAIERRAGPLAPASPVGYVVRFVREVDGIPIRGNLVADHISVLVGPGGVVGVSRYWPEVTVGGSAPWRGSLLPAGRAALLAADDISRALKGAQLDLLEAEPVYGTLGPSGGPGDLEPAYALRSPSGSVVVVSALSGDILR